MKTIVKTIRMFDHLYLETSPLLAELLGDWGHKEKVTITYIAIDEADFFDIVDRLHHDGIDIESVDYAHTNESVLKEWIEEE